MPYKPQRRMRPQHYGPATRDYRGDSRPQRMMNDNRSGADYRDGNDYEDYNDYADYNDGVNYYNDYAQDGHYPQYLKPKELMKWGKKLLEEVDEKEKSQFSMQNIEKSAREIGVRFDDTITKDEFYVTVLMQYTDYCKTLGIANMDLYLRMAKDWLNDEDSELQGGEKLAAYYYAVIMAK